MDKSGGMYRFRCQSWHLIHYAQDLAQIVEEDEDTMVRSAVSPTLLLPCVDTTTLRRHCSMGDPDDVSVYRYVRISACSSLQTDISRHWVTPRLTVFPSLAESAPEFRLYFARPMFKARKRIGCP
jgi:hypothetical protein